MAKTPHHEAQPGEADDEDRKGESLGDATDARTATKSNLPIGIRSAAKTSIPGSVTSQGMHGTLYCVAPDGLRHRRSHPDYRTISCRLLTTEEEKAGTAPPSSSYHPRIAKKDGSHEHPWTRDPESSPSRRNIRVFLGRFRLPNNPIGADSSNWPGTGSQADLLAPKSSAVPPKPGVLPGWPGS